MRILLVEDELKVARFIRQGLEAEGYEVDVAADGQSGEQKATGEQFDLLILDVLLPKKNGFDILHSLRHDGIKVPVLMLTARSATEDIVKGLDTGADDYLTKPFAFDELLARVRSLLRRGSDAKRVLKVADLELDTLSRRATRKGRRIDLTTREYTLLEFLLRKLGRLVTRDQLAKEVWGLDFDPGTNIVDVYINHLRKKIDQGSETKLIHTERGKGYFISDKNSPATRR
ncbi:MAG: response regulator transcription factor [Ignavibacteriales bacterium]|nr:response regulator transcription factor [Ignavibacteriales bacterium]